MSRIIPLTQGKVAIVDDEDYRKLSKFKWMYHKGTPNLYGYAIRNSRTVNGKRSAIRMHRVIAKCPEHLEVHHIDGDGLNNQKNNLKVCNHHYNVRHRAVCRKSITGVSGVTPERDKFRAQVRIDGVAHYLGLYPTIEEADKIVQRFKDKVKPTEVFSEAV